MFFCLTKYKVVCYEVLEETCVLSMTGSIEVMTLVSETNMQFKQWEGVIAQNWARLKNMK